MQKSKRKLLKRKSAILTAILLCDYGKRGKNETLRLNWDALFELSEIRQLTDK